MTQLLCSDNKHPYELIGILSGTILAGCYSFVFRCSVCKDIVRTNFGSSQLLIPIDERSLLISKAIFEKGMFPEL